MARAKSKPKELTASQLAALDVLQGSRNVFLTGAAGSGKSFLLNYYLSKAKKDSKTLPILASTGVAAILVGGRTFHSFFGIGILEGGVKAKVQRAAKNKRLLTRLRKADGVIIDEISMLSGPHLQAAEKIARLAREDRRPWGGLRVIAVGDFAQLPPVNVYGEERHWAFLDPVWHESQFTPVFLDEIVRTRHRDFLEVLNHVRSGKVSREVKEFLDERKVATYDPEEVTRLFARRDDVEKYNLERLAQVKTPAVSFETVYTGKEKELEKFKKNAPIPDVITLKEGALVMLRQNDVEGRWVNGSLGHVCTIEDESLGIELLSEDFVEVEKTDFTLLDADGKSVASAHNFPVTLAWAMTIHKSQGATIDQALVDLRRLWEPGQAYVALSRVRDPSGLFVEGWTPSSIITDPYVSSFYRSLFEEPAQESAEDSFEDGFGESTEEYPE